MRKPAHSRMHVLVPSFLFLAALSFGGWPTAWALLSLLCRGLPRRMLTFTSLQNSCRPEGQTLDVTFFSTQMDEEGEGG